MKDAVDDWLIFGLGHQAASTVSVCATHIVRKLGARKLRDLTAREVDCWLKGLAPHLCTDMLRRTHACLDRAVRRAMVRDLVRRNVVELAEIPTGSGRTAIEVAHAQQVDAVLSMTAEDRMHRYIVLSLLTGTRTEELRALCWNHVHLSGHPDHSPPVPPYIEVWRSVRPGGDTKTRRSRRMLALPPRCIESLKKQRGATGGGPAGRRVELAGLRPSVHDEARNGDGRRQHAARLPAGAEAGARPRPGPADSAGAAASSRCSRTRACRWRRFRVWSATAVRRSPSWSTGTS